MNNGVADILVTCNGCFDGIHPGHMFFLGFCRGQGTRLIVGINTDEYIIAKKRPHPLPQYQRMRDLMELGFIDEVEIFREETASEFITRRMPSIHCISEEYGQAAPEVRTCLDLGIRVVFVPRIGTWSSTVMRGKK